MSLRHGHYEMSCNEMAFLFNTSRCPRYDDLTALVYLYRTEAFRALSQPHLIPQDLRSPSDEMEVDGG